MVFRNLSPKENEEFRAHAREHFEELQTKQFNQFMVFHEKNGTDIFVDEEEYNE